MTYAVDPPEEGRAAFRGDLPEQDISDNGGNEKRASHEGAVLVEALDDVSRGRVSLVLVLSKI